MSETTLCFITDANLKHCMRYSRENIIIFPRNLWLNWINIVSIYMLTVKRKEKNNTKL